MCALGFFFFKQKTAYEMRISDWSSDVCSSDLAKYFPPETKAAMDILVKNVLAALDTRITNLTWMQPETKVKAKKKLANFTTKIGYPDRWKDYSKLEIKADDLFGNALRSNQFAHDDNISRLGGPIRRWEWLPGTVAALLAARSEEHTSELQSLMR